MNNLTKTGNIISMTIYKRDGKTVSVTKKINPVTGKITNWLNNKNYQLIEPEKYTTRSYNNGNPNWKNIVSEWSDRSMANMYNYGNIPQYTKVSSISLQRLCNLLFGKVDANGDHVEYEVHIAAPLTPIAGYPMANNGMNMSVNYMLAITVVSSEEVSKIYEKLGYGSFGGARIVR